MTHERDTLLGMAILALAAMMGIGTAAASETDDAAAMMSASELPVRMDGVEGPPTEEAMRRAKHCVVENDAIVCFRSRSRLQRHLEPVGSALQPLNHGTACGGYVTLYEHTRYGGRSITFRPHQIEGHTRDLGDYKFGTWPFRHSWNDRVSSIRNRSNCCVLLSRHSGGGCPRTHAHPRTSYPSMRSGWNDEISSLTMAVRTCSSC